MRLVRSLILISEAIGVLAGQGLTGSWKFDVAKSKFTSRKQDATCVLGHRLK